MPHACWCDNNYKMGNAPACLLQSSQRNWWTWYYWKVHITFGFDIAESHRNSVSTQILLGHIGTRFASCPPRFRSTYPHANASPPHLKLHAHGMYHLNVFRRTVRPEESSELHCAKRLFLEFCSTGAARLLVRPFPVPWCTTRIWSSTLSSEEITCRQNTNSAPCPWSSRKTNPRNVGSPETRNIILWTPFSIHELNMIGCDTTLWTPLHYLTIHTITSHHSPLNAFNILCLWHQQFTPINIQDSML